MKRLLMLTIVTSGSFVALTPSASARPFRYWYPNELWEKADVVVMATVESTQDKPNVTIPADAKANTLIPVITKFEVQAVFKGPLEKKSPLDKLSVDVEHSRYYDKVALRTTIDGPAFVEFNPKLKNSYLLFLAGPPGLPILRHLDGPLTGKPIRPLVAKQSSPYYPLTGDYDPHHSFVRLEQYDGNKEQEK